MKYLLTILLLAGFVAIVLDNPGKDHWDNVGPKWACMLNPNKYDFCKIEE